MKYWSVTFSRLPAAAMALFPFMIFKNKRLRNDSVIINHEKIHFIQQLELLIVFFYLFYILNYLYNLIKYRDHKVAYYNICFEKEAYQNEQDLLYLKKRRLYSWIMLV